LLIEWPEGEAAPTKYWLSNIAKTISFHDLVDIAKMRWRIERDYQDLKQEIGLGHYEGRGWRGFHHHGTPCIAAYGFLISEREQSYVVSHSRPFARRRINPFHAAIFWLKRVQTFARICRRASGLCSPTVAHGNCSSTRSHDTDVRPPIAHRPFSPRIAPGTSRDTDRGLGRPPPRLRHPGQRHQGRRPGAARQGR
jgi:hypothetical protein